MQDKKRQLHHEGNEGNPGNAALRSGIIDFVVPATNDSPLDHARRAAGGELREKWLIPL